MKHFFHSVYKPRKGFKTKAADNYLWQGQLAVYHSNLLLNTLQYLTLQVSSIFAQWTITVNYSMHDAHGMFCRPYSTYLYDVSFGVKMLSSMMENDFLKEDLMLISLMEWSGGYCGSLLSCHRYEEMISWNMCYESIPLFYICSITRVINFVNWLLKLVSVYLGVNFCADWWSIMDLLYTACQVLIGSICFFNYQQNLF